MDEIQFTNDDRFEVGGEDLLAPIQIKSVSSNSQPQESAAGQRRLAIIDDLQVRLGTLLKTETVSLLLGAGASVDCGGQLIGSVPLSLERVLINEGITGDRDFRIRRWLMVFYLATRHASCGAETPLTRQGILDRRTKIENGQAEPLRANFEQILSTLQRWRFALPDVGGRLRVDGQPRVDVTGQDLEACLGQATHSLARVCDLPTSDKEDGIEHHKNLVRKLLTRPLNLKRANIFTLNYDTLIEQAADAAGVVLLDGFVGTQRRVFRPESYEQDLYFPAETTEGRVHRFDRVLHLYKLHGSITWSAEESQIDNPYGVRSATFNPHEAEPLLIYPMASKYGETLGIPYSELFRRFASALVRPQSVLVTIGYGFGDEHVNAIIRQAMAIPSFTLVVVDPRPESSFVTQLRKLKDRRLWIAQGPKIGTFAGFVNWILPDLRDEEIRKKVLATHNVLAKLE